MRKSGIMALLFLLSSGCGWINENFYDRLLFVEESHIGLKAKVGMDHTPGDVDFGYRRSVLALIPKADAGAKNKSVTAENHKTLESVVRAAREKAEKEAKTATKSEQEATAYVVDAIDHATRRYIQDINVAKGENPDCPSDLLDRSEPLSVISSFNADVRWFEATRVRTYFATGTAATRTACDVHAIKALVATPNE